MSETSDNDVQSLALNVDVLHFVSKPQYVKGGWARKWRPRLPNFPLLVTL